MNRTLLLQANLGFAAILLSFCSFSSTVQGQAYIFNGGNPDVVTHVKGYNGTGGNINITVGIDPSSVNASAMSISVQNVIRTWNNLQATTGNVQLSAISNSEVDFESVLLHEMGHSLGLAHVNIASESGQPQSNHDYSASQVGDDGVFNLNAGADGIIGSSDDIRGDDINLNFFERGVNNPFVLNSSGIFDSTTYTRDLSELPAGHNFAANADLAVANSLGFANTEAVMQQGTRFGEIQRSLAASDVIGMRYAMSGVDEIQGSGDDYTFNLEFVGEDAGADILIDFDNSQTGFAVSGSSATGLTSNHLAITNTQIFFNSNANWHFNDTLAVPEPTSFGLLAAVSLSGLIFRRRK